MPGNEASRRDVLRAGAGLVAAASLGSTAGCIGGVSNVLGGSGAGSRAKQSPEDSQAVLAVDVEAVLDDEATERIANAYFETASRNEYYSGPESYEAALEEAEEESDLDPTGLRWAVGFAGDGAIRARADAYGGVAFAADWTEEDLVAVMEENGAEFEEREYGDRTIYEDVRDYAETDLGVLGDDQYVLGTPDAVEDVIDVDNDDEDAIGEDLTGAFESARDGAPIKFATEVPEEAVPGRVPVGRGDSIELDAFQDVGHVAGAVYSADEAVGVELRLLAADAETAEEVKEQTEALVTVSQSMESTTEEMEAFLDGIEVEISGDTTVVISYEQAVDAIVEQIEGLAE